MFQLPWSNFHELNLDWIMNKLKELDDKIIGSSTPSADPPEMDGVASPGVADTFSRGDHRHPTDTSRASASALTQEITDRGDADILINNRIDTLDARVVPSDAYPLMDGTAESGSHVQYSRRDHRHPTDTSRAAQTDLQAEIDDRINDVNALQGDINAVDAKINFSSAAPLMDSSSASSGSSTVMARADHVHPTDTSRASATDVATLQARMDAFAGSALPSDLTPNMDGVGSAGSGGNYSRGDHVHPSDTSKLDKTGGTITGDLTINGQLMEDKRHTFANLNAIGWYRVANVPKSAGTGVIILISKRGDNTPSEFHQIDLEISEYYAYEGEVSRGSVKYIDKIRYTSAGAIDIHMDQAYAASVGVTIIPSASSKARLLAIEAIPFQLVANAPAGETIHIVYDFSTVTHGDVTANASMTDAANFVAYRDGDMVTLSFRSIVKSYAEDDVIGTLGAELAPVTTIFLPASYGTGSCVIRIQTNGTVDLYSFAVTGSGRLCFNATYPVK